MSEILSERVEMSASVEASNLMRAIAEPAPAGVHIEALIRNVARKVGLSFRRAKAIWYGEARLILAEEMDALRAAASARRATESVLSKDLERFSAELVARVARLDDQLSRLGAN